MPLFGYGNSTRGASNACRDRMESEKKTPAGCVHQDMPMHNRAGDRLWKTLELSPAQNERQARNFAVVVAIRRLQGVVRQSDRRHTLMIQIRAARRASCVPHRHVLAALAFDVVADDARAEEAAAGAAARACWLFGWIVEHVRIARRGVASMTRSLPALDRFTLQCFAGFAHGERIGNLHDHLALAMRAQAFLPGVLVFDFEDVSVGTFNLNSHGRPTSRTADEAERVYESVRTGRGVEKLHAS